MCGAAWETRASARLGLRAPGSGGARQRPDRDAQQDADTGQRDGRRRRRGVGPLLLAAALACSSCSAQHVHIDLAEQRPARAGRGGGRRQAGAAADPPKPRMRCLTAVVQRPTIGQCIEVFSRPVPMRTCVGNETEAQARVDLPQFGPRARCPSPPPPSSPGPPACPRCVVGPRPRALRRGL